MKGGRKLPLNSPGPVEIAQSLIARIRQWKSQRIFFQRQLWDKEQRMENLREIISHQPVTNTGGEPFAAGPITLPRLEQYQDAGDWWELRQRFREDARKALREREGLGDYEMGPRGEKYQSGLLPGPSREEIEQFWTESTPAFTLAEGDGRLEEERKDLMRDARRMENAEKVMHLDQGRENQMLINLDSEVIDDDDLLDAALQQFVSNVEKARKL